MQSEKVDELLCYIAISITSFSLRPGNNEVIIGQDVCIQTR